MIIAGKVKGIPCQFLVTSFNCVDPDPWADNPADYYGYAEVEYEVLDRRGRRALWLEDKLDSHENERITNIIEECVKRNAYEDDGQ